MCREESGRVAAERARIDRTIAGRTLVGALAATVARHADDAAIWWRPACCWEEGRPDGWELWTWRTFREHVRDFAMGLRRLGLERGDFILLMAGTHPAHLVADQAAMHLRATPVSLYPTLSPTQLRFQARACGARIALAQGPACLEQVLAVPGLEHVVAIDASSGDPRAVCWQEVLEIGRRERRRSPDVLEGIAESVHPDDLATLIWTSGTTGVPKAVMVTHRTALWMQASVHLAAPLGPSDRLVSYLPMAHLAGRFLSLWQPVMRATPVWLCPDPAQLTVALTEARPTRFFGVPRVWEKYAAAVGLAFGGSRAGGDKGSHAPSGSPASGGSPLGSPAGQGAEVATACLERMGLDRCRVAMSGGAPIDPAVIELFRVLGLGISEIWGMTETGAATWNGTRCMRAGTVGRPMPGIEVRALDDGELLVRGGSVTPGYFGDPDATAEAIDAEGWMHTGDIGRIDEDGYVTIVDRKKEIIVTSGGKNVSPALLEGLVKRHELVGEVCVVGDRRPYPAALIVLNPSVAAAWARTRGLGHLGLEQLAASPEVRLEIGRAVDAANRMVSRPEQIKRFTILPDQWTIEGDELTPTLKKRRSRIQAKHAAEIEGMYA
jgi:long-chain acyl-CoA synthetase